MKLKAMMALVAAMLFMGDARAQPPEMHWLDAEAIELRKIVDSGVKLAKAQEHVAFVIPTLGKTATAPVLEKLFKAQNSVRVALSMAFSSESNSSLTRAQELSALFAQVDSIDAARDEARLLLNSMPEDNTRVKRAKSALDGITIETFSKTLAYADPLPLSFPRIIGPHGDHEQGQASLEHFTQYVHHTYFDAWNFWTRTDALASEAAKDFFRHNSRASALNYRAWGMTVEIVLPDDDAKIRSDLAAGSGIRSYGFFREILALEYLYNGASGRRNFAGRKTDLGSKAFVRSFGDAFTKMSGELRILNPAQFDEQWLGRRGAVSNTGQNGWAAEFYFDFADFWNVLDSYAFDAMGFFFALPGPPCGEGTHAEGGFCVPN